MKINQHSIFIKSNPKWIKFIQIRNLKLYENLFSSFIRSKLFCLAEKLANDSTFFYFNRLLLKGERKCFRQNWIIKIEI